MRWRFLDPNNRAEAAERSAILARIDAWWRAFEAKTKEIDALFRREAGWDLPEWMQNHLQAIHPKLMWEYGPAVRGDGRRLVITPESAHHLRPLTDSILERAPALEGWEFYAYRQPETLEVARQSVEARTGCYLNDYRVKASIGEAGLVNLTYAAPSIPKANDNDSLHAAFVATEELLGEQCLDRWVGGIEAVPLPGTSGLKSLFGRGGKDVQHYFALDRLKDTVDALIASMREQLRPAPHYEWVDKAQWQLWKLKPEQADEYVRQDDLFVAKSANPKQWVGAHSSGYFASERFSRCGETFCFVKIDRTEGLDEKQFADKSAIEDALDLVLKPAKLGCFMGGGTGVRYSYIDLALTDVDKGIEAVTRRLRAGNIPKRTWIQFFDCELAAEWVGVYDDTPPPPMPPEEA